MSNFLIKITENTTFGTTDLFGYCGKYQTELTVAYPFLVLRGEGLMPGLLRIIVQSSKMIYISRCNLFGESFGTINKNFEFWMN